MSQQETSTPSMDTITRDFAPTLPPSELSRRAEAERTLTVKIRKTRSYANVSSKPSQRFTIESIHPGSELLKGHLKEFLGLGYTLGLKKRIKTEWDMTYTISPATEFSLEKLTSETQDAIKSEMSINNMPLNEVLIDVVWSSSTKK